MKHGGGLAVVVVVVAVAHEAKNLFSLMIVVTIPSTNRSKACDFKDPLPL